MYFGFCCKHLFVKILNYVFWLCILSYYTYNGTKYLERQFDHISSVLECFFSYVYHLCLHWGVF